MIGPIVRHPRIVVILEVDCSAEDGPVPRDHFIQAVCLEGDMMQRGSDDRHCWPPKLFPSLTAIVMRFPAHCWFACFAGQLSEQSLRTGESSVDGMSAWVETGHFGESERCPLYPQKRPLIECPRMFALCQLRTHASQQKVCHSITSSASTRRLCGSSFSSIPFLIPVITCCFRGFPTTPFQKSKKLTD